MPSKNVIKSFAPGHYYHVYNRGAGKLPVFHDSKDKGRFIKTLKRHLDPADKSIKTDGTAYRKFHQDLELLCYCLMGNHFHLLFYIKEDGEAEGISSLMKSVLTAYTMYFNKRHKRPGVLFQGVFRASRISDEGYLLHITRYIHLNPREYKTYIYSSIAYYLGEDAPTWLDVKPVLEMFEGVDYLEFLQDYEDRKTMLEEIKHELADQ